MYLLERNQFRKGEVQNSATYIVCPIFPRGSYIFDQTKLTQYLHFRTRIRTEQLKMVFGIHPPSEKQKNVLCLQSCLQGRLRYKDTKGNRLSDTETFYSDFDVHMAHGYQVGHIRPSRSHH
jgi:hypothetical protein